MRWCEPWTTALCRPAHVVNKTEANTQQGGRLELRVVCSVRTGVGSLFHTSLFGVGAAAVAMLDLEGDCQSVHSIAFFRRSVSLRVCQHWQIPIIHVHDPAYMVPQSCGASGGCFIVCGIRGLCRGKQPRGIRSGQVIAWC